jgi:hypothetical protein
VHCTDNCASGNVACDLTAALAHAQSGQEIRVYGDAHLSCSVTGSGATLSNLADVKVIRGMSRSLLIL